MWSCQIFAEARKLGHDVVTPATATSKPFTDVSRQLIPASQRHRHAVVTSQHASPPPARWAPCRGRAPSFGHSVHLPRAEHHTDRLASPHTLAVARHVLPRLASPHTLAVAAWCPSQPYAGLARFFVSSRFAAQASCRHCTCSGKLAATPRRSLLHSHAACARRHHSALARCRLPRYKPLPNRTTLAASRR